MYMGTESWVKIATPKAYLCSHEAPTASAACACRSSQSVIPRLECIKMIAELPHRQTSMNAEVLQIDHDRVHIALVARLGLRVVDLVASEGHLVRTRNIHGSGCNSFIEILPYNHSF